MDRIDPIAWRQPGAAPVTPVAGGPRPPRRKPEREQPPRKRPTAARPTDTDTDTPKDGPSHVDVRA
jgi:hypothetical protein